MARFATVTSIAWTAAPGQTVAEACAHAGSLARAAAAHQPDLIIFPEVFLQNGLHGDIWAQGMPLPNPATDYFSALAREIRANLVVPMILTVEGDTYNSAVVIDRQGAIVGRYDKVHPTIAELEAGVRPGEGARVHQLDFGRIGHAICFDLNFPHLAEEMRDMDVDLIGFYSMFAGGQMLNHWAFTTGAYLLSAYTEESHLIDMTGQDLTSMGQRYEAYRYWPLPPTLTARVNLDRRLFHVDYNIGDYNGQHGGVLKLLAERPHAVTLDFNHTAGVVAIGAQEGATLADLVAQYGLEPRNAYFRRALDRWKDARHRRVTL
jgi:hypothetical protein